MEPKTSKLPLGISVCLLRHVQWFFALVSHVLFQRVFNHLQATLEVPGGVRAVPVMNSITLAYCSLALVGVYVSRTLPVTRRYKLELLSVLADLCFAILFLVKGALLNSTRLDCEVLFEEKFWSPGPSRDLDRPYLLKRAFVSLGIDDIDRQCAASMSIYWISLITIMLYSLSILLTLLRLRVYRRVLLVGRRAAFGGVADHIEEAIEVPSPEAVQRVSSSSSFRSPAYSAENHPHRQDRQPGLDFLTPVFHRPRSSQETSSAELGLLSDASRPSEEIVPYHASRPASVHSCKGD